MGDEPVGRAGGNIRHLRHAGTQQTGDTKKDRAALLYESMRELSERATEYWAAANPNVVPSDTSLNVALVNDGNGGFRRPSSIQEVLDYGDARIENVYREWNPNSFETTLIVVHLPKSMCDEVKDFYPILDEKTGEPVLGKDGQPRMRSRWVAKDRDQAMKFFEDVLGYYSTKVLNGGQAAIHGADINFDESTPHIQIMADTLASDPKHDGYLRVEASQMWGAHRDVTVEKIDKTTGQPVLDEDGQPVRVMEQPKAKMSRYQRGLRELMVERGYPVEVDYDPIRHDLSDSKSGYAAVQDRQRELDEREAEVEQLTEQARLDYAAAEAALKSEVIQTRDKAFAKVDELAAVRITQAEAQAQQIVDAAEQDRAAAQRVWEQVEEALREVQATRDEGSELLEGLRAVEPPSDKDLDRAMPDIVRRFFEQHDRQLAAAEAKDGRPRQRWSDKFREFARKEYEAAKLGRVGSQQIHSASDFETWAAVTRGTIEDFTQRRLEADRLHRQQVWRQQREAARDDPGLGRSR